jgi:hypothetical protein
MTEQHGLLLRSRGGLDMLYLAECSCGGWAVDLVNWAEACQGHAAHLQEHLGPDRAEARQ